MSLCSLSYLGGVLDRVSAISCGSDAVMCPVTGRIIRQSVPMTAEYRLCRLRSSVYLQLLSTIIPFLIHIRKRSLASCVPHPNFCGDTAAVSATTPSTDSSATNQLKHWPVVRVAEGLNSRAGTSRSIHSFSGAKAARSDDISEQWAFLTEKFFLAF